MNDFQKIQNQKDAFLVVLESEYGKQWTKKPIEEISEIVKEVLHNICHEEKKAFVSTDLAIALLADSSIARNPALLCYIVDLANDNQDVVHAALQIEGISNETRASLNLRLHSVVESVTK